MRSGGILILPLHGESYTGDGVGTLPSDSEPIPMSARNQPLEELHDRLLESGGHALLIQTAFLGDVILSTPLARAFKQAFPRAELHTLTLPQTAVVMKPWAEQLLTIDKRDRTRLKEAWEKTAAVIKDAHYDLALIPHRSWRSGRLASTAVIPVRIGFQRGSGAWFHTHRQPYQRNLYEGRRSLSILNPLIETADTGLPELQPSVEDFQVVDGFLRDLSLQNENFAVIAPGSVWFTKRWPEEHYRRLTQLLEREHGLPVTAIGGEEDRDLCVRIVSRPETCLAGRLNIMQSAALVSRARFIISGDTAPAHIATAVGTRQIIIYGSTVPEFGFAPPVETCRTAQISLWCRPCTDHGRHHCPKFGSLDCLKGISPEGVLKVARDWL